MGKCASCFVAAEPPPRGHPPLALSPPAALPQENLPQGPLDLPHSKAQTIMGSKKGKLSISDFRIEKCLGRGAFGKVYLVRMHKAKGHRLLAMKVMRKSDIIENNLVENILLEKKILQKSKHPFLVQLKYAFQTNVKLYLVMTYVPGGELFTLLRRQKTFPEETLKFYAAQVLCGIEYLHTQMNVIYRDLKPENVLLTKEGNIQMTDFGLAKSSQGVTYTFAGTPEYLAPEIIMAKGHTKQVDWWSLGILMYEMAVGRPPFTDKERNVARIEKLILENDVKYPQLMSAQLRNLIENLLKTDPEKRLQAGQIKTHPFFSKVNWQDVLQLKVQPPFVNTVGQNIKPFIKPGEIVETVDDKMPHFEGFTQQQSGLASVYTKY